jgi:hypothetical protein
MWQEFCQVFCLHQFGCGGFDVPAWATRRKLENLMSIEKWIEENCQCGIKNGEWSEALFEQHGCTCRDRIPDFGYIWVDGECIEVER